MGELFLNTAFLQPVDVFPSAVMPANAIPAHAARKADLRALRSMLLLGSAALALMPALQTAARAQSVADPSGSNIVTTSDSIAIANPGQVTAPVGIVAGSSTGAVSITNGGRIGGATVGIAAASGGPVSIANLAGGQVVFGLLGIAGASGSLLTLTNNGALTQDRSLPNALTQAQFSSLPAQYQMLGSFPQAAIFGRTFGADLAVANAGQIIAQTGIDAAVLNAPNGGISGRLTITNTGTIVASGGPAINTSLSVVGAQVVNAGAITGFLTLNSGSTFTNMPGGLFNATGTSGFGGGTLLNGGTVALLAGAGPVSATLGNVSTFTNVGTIDLRTGTAANTLTVGGNYFGQNGTLLMQASTQANTTDRLVITGNASGTTGIGITNLTPGTTAFSTSQVLVQVNGTTTANAFALASAQNFGTLQPVIVNGISNGVNTVAIGTVPNAAALSGPTAVIASRTIAEQGSSAILDRVQQLRDGKQAPGGTPAVAPLQYASTTGYAALISKDPIAQNVVQPVAPVDTSVRVATWARATGDLERRTGSSSFSFAGSLFTRDLGYTQETGALLGGADAVISGLTSADDAVILGVLGGYTTATVNLNNNAGRQDYDGGTVGAYATYLNGPFFVDALFKVDLLGLNITLPGLRQNTGLTNYSFASNIGYRIPLDHGVYIEPTAGIDYVDTQFDRTAALTTSTVPLRNGDAVRGRIGARVGSEAIIDNVRFEPSVTAYAYTVLTESNPSGVFNGATSVTGLRDQGKARGEVQAAISVFDLKSGVSGFIRADMRVGSDLLAGGGRIGVRYQW